MKKLYYITIVILCSCSKQSATLNQFGNILGSITLYEKSGNENQNFDNISVKLIDAQNQVLFGTVDADGKFQFEKVLKGDVLLVFNKPGYNYIDTIKFDHNNLNDTLSTVTLIEDLPFTLKNSGVSYEAGWLNYPFTYDYQTTTDQYLVTYFICFSKTPDVSMTKAALTWPYGGYWNVLYVRVLGGRATFSVKNFTDAGFKIGDKIYAALVPVSKKYGDLYTDVLDKKNLNCNYQIVSVKAATTSNVTYFILNE